MKILTKYVIREHIGPLTFTLSALTALMILNQVAKQFGQLVGKGLSWGVIGEFFYLSLPFIVAMTMPMAVLLAVLYAFSRLAAENEITALRANGVTTFRIIRPVMMGGVVLALAMLLFNDQVLPRANHRLRTLQTDIARKKPTFALREQVINEVIPGRIFLRTGHIDDATNKMREVFIYNFEDPARRKTIYADSGQMGLTRDQSTLQMTLHHGWVLQVSRDDPETLERLYFNTDLVRVRGVANKFEKTKHDTYKGEREMTVCEMNRQYQAGVRELQVARYDLATLLGNAARFAATGQPPGPSSRAPQHDQRTSGALYCDMITRVLGWFGVQQVEAAELPPAQQATARPAPATRTPQAGRAPAGTARTAPPPATAESVRARPDSVPRNPAQLAPVVSRAQLEVMQSRIEDARQTVSRYEVEIQKKFALAAACVVFVLFGAPIALRFPRGGVGLVIGVGLVSFSLYYVCLVAGETLADKLILSPFWAMWAANAIFGVIGVVMLVRVQRHGATARGGDVREAIDTVRGWFARSRRGERDS